MELWEPRRNYLLLVRSLQQTGQSTVGIPVPYTLDTGEHYLEEFHLIKRGSFGFVAKVLPRECQDIDMLGRDTS
jgi:hypothetical protein